MFFLLLPLSLPSPGPNRPHRSKFGIFSRCSSFQSVPHTSAFPDTGVCYVVPAHPSGFTINPQNTENLYIEIDGLSAQAVPAGGITVAPNKSAVVYRKSSAPIFFACSAALFLGSVLVFVVFLCGSNGADVFPDLPPPPTEPARPLPNQSPGFRDPIGPGIGFRPYYQAQSPPMQPYQQAPPPPPAYTQVPPQQPIYPPPPPYAGQQHYLQAGTQNPYAAPY